MTQPKISELAKHKLQKFHWPVWFPYPSSWLRALILVPIVFFAIRLIAFSLTGVLISFSRNTPKLLILSTLFGLLIPTIFLAFIYHIFWFFWGSKSYNNRLPKWILSLISLWSGFYATVVIGLSFLIVLVIFSELAFSNCKLSYEIAEELSGYAGCITGRATRVIFKSIENKTFVNKPWFIIWLLTATYLYQIEYLFSQCLMPKLISILTKNKFKRQPNSVDNTDLNVDRLQGDMGVIQMEKERKQQSNMTSLPQYYNQKPKKRKKQLLILFLISLTALGIYLFPKLSEVKDNIPFHLIPTSQTKLPSKTVTLTP
ncbi:hypothetical protein I8748_03105 [Nostoc sp. CENA67]|uniref:Transmembrane protein n=1 Tax=Amazonocrinis nigriterrae CENA67 TaxID=2794033 RepID=A0A8J7L6J9_9NOST|nr:hypothetical protein [Amazonocrinis nigriterrae]MBH8561175.1 hypothetical protein [Amazonocrinis nigriterrae CENA67]